VFVPNANTDFVYMVRAGLVRWERRQVDDRDFLEEVRSRTDIIELVSDYVKLERRGKNFVGLCPFHDDRNPSFSVSPEHGLYYCFACQAGGDAFKFIMEMEGLSFPEALERLARRAGVPLPERADTVGAQTARRQRDYLVRVMELACSYYQRNLWEKPEGRQGLEYLRGRGLSDETIRRFGLGLALDSWDGLLREAQGRKVKPRALEQLGLCLARKDGSGYYDYFRHRVMFPIRDERGRPVGFGGRAMGLDEPKYLNSRQTRVFDKGRLMYGLDRARGFIRQKERAVVVEGYMDVIACHSHGFEETVAPMGTALTSDQAQLLKRYTDQVYLAFDADAAGTRAALKGIETMQGAGFSVKVVPLPSGLDPDDFLREKGAGAWEEALAGALSFFDFRWEVAAARWDPGDSTEKARLVAAMAPTVLSSPDPVVRADYIRFLAEELGVREEAVVAQLRRFRGQMGRHSPAKTAGQHKRGDSRDNTKEISTTRAITERANVLAAERNVLRLILESRRFLETSKEILSVADFQNEELRRIADIVFVADSEDHERLGERLRRDLSAEEQGTAAALLLGGGVPGENRDKVFRDSAGVLLKERRLRRIEEIDREIRRCERKGLSVSPEILQEKMELLRKNKSSRL